MDKELMTHEELMSKARKAADVEELLELAKSENIELTEEKAKKLFAELHAEGEISDDELDNVAGGGCSGEPEYTLPSYSEGEIVAVKSKYRCNACGCEFGKIVRVFKGYCNSSECRYDYTLICTNCGNQFEADETKYSWDFRSTRSDIIGRLS